MLKKVFQRLSQNKDLQTASLIALAAFIIRVAWLHKYPIGITHDELNYVIAAKSLFFSGWFAPGTAPTVFPAFMSSFNVVIAEIPSLLLAPFIGVFKLSLFNARLYGAILSSASVFVLYFLVLNLLKNRSYALFSSLALTYNPWSILLGRTIFETNFFVFFFLVGFLILIKNQNEKIFRAMPFYLLGFLSYTGGQVAFLIFIILTLVYHYFKHGRSNRRPYIYFTAIFVLIFIAYVFITLKNQAVLSRGSELLLPGSDYISQQVDDLRKVSVPLGVNTLFINKATVYGSEFLSRYLGAFSPTTLFVTGEFRAAFSYQKHGNFYFIDLVFILLGILILFSKKRREAILIILIIFSAPITSAFSQVEYSYSQRAALMYPFLTIFIGIGLSWLVNVVLTDKRKLLRLPLLVIYAVLFVNLLHIYFFRFPVYASDGWFYQDRILSKYLQYYTQGKNSAAITVFSSEPKITFQEYLFYSNNYHGKENIKYFNDNFIRGIFIHDNIYITDGCPDGEIGEGEVWILDSILGCKYEGPSLRITRFNDSWTKYYVINDNICEDVELNSYVPLTSFVNFDIDREIRQDFCSGWISK